MRHLLGALLALPALLATLALSAPPPPAIPQSPFLLPLPERQPLWKSVSNRVIASIWGPSSAPHPHAPTRMRHGGDLVVRFNVTTAEEVESLARAADTLLLDVWEFAREFVDIRLNKDIFPSLLGLLPSLQNKYAVLLGERELEQAIYDSTSRLPYTPLVSHLHGRPQIDHTPQTTDDESSDIFFSNYQPLAVIEPWMRLLAELFPGYVQLITIGTTYENRSILALRVGVHPSSDPEEFPPPRRTILITGGVHAREWISTTTVNYLAYHLITSYRQNPAITHLLESFDFVFVPTLNPDGYAYTWSTDRLWRKNRQRTSVRFCQGLDLDRGYGFEWDSAAGNPCSENFAGDAPFQAVEAKQLADWAKNETEHGVEFVAFMDLHSYSQQILYPYSYSCRDSPPGQENLEEVAIGLEKAIRMESSLNYEVLAACEGNVAVQTTEDGEHKKSLLPLMEAQGGSALDWFYHEMHVRYAYQIKLRDRGTYGFLLPKEQIVPTGKEILSAVLYLGGFLSGAYGAEVQEDQERSSRLERLVEEAEVTGWLVEDGVRSLGERKWDLRRKRR